jgi:hypothetical protein
VIAVRVYGEDRVRSAFGRMRRGVDNLTAAWRRINAELLSTAVPLTPVLTGRLVRSLKAEASRMETTFSAGGGDVVYAGNQNYGWPARNIQARHFFDGAIDANREEIPGEVMSAVEAVARRAGLL